MAARARARSAATWPRASIGTDGIDGPTDAAGAIVDSTTAVARDGGGSRSPDTLPRRQQQLRVLRRLGDLIRTGPTSTNVGDLQVILIADDLARRRHPPPHPRDRFITPPPRASSRSCCAIPREERTTLQAPAQGARRPSGELLQIRGNRFGLPEKMDLVVGRLQTNPGGFGFVVPEHADAGRARRTSTSPPPNLTEAMHGDRVVARVERQTREGARRTHHPHPRAQPGDRRRPLRGGRRRVSATSCRSTAAS